MAVLPCLESGDRVSEEFCLPVKMDAIYLPNWRHYFNGRGIATACSGDKYEEESESADTDGTNAGKGEGEKLSRRSKMIGFGYEQ